MTDITDRHVAILVHDYFEQVEFTEPKAILEAAGAQVSIISTGAETLHGMHHTELADEFIPDEYLENVVFEHFDMLVLPGGVFNSDQLRMNERAQEWAQHCIEHGVPLAAICHAPWLLVSAGVTEDLKLTSYFTLQDDIKNADGNWVDAELVIDGSVITSRGPKDLPVFTQALIDTLVRSE